jgi:hypothetical protein
MNDYQDGRRDEAYLRGLSQEIKALKVERDQCRELSELRLQSEQKLLTERDNINAAVTEIVAERDKLLERLAANAHYNEAILAENQKLRAALEGLLNAGIIDDEQTVQAREVARRALETERGK